MNWGYPSCFIFSASEWQPTQTSPAKAWPAIIVNIPESSKNTDSFFILPPAFLRYGLRKVKLMFLQVRCYYIRKGSAKYTENGNKSHFGSGTHAKVGFTPAMPKTNPQSCFTMLFTSFPKTPGHYLDRFRATISASFLTDIVDTISLLSLP